MQNNFFSQNSTKDRMTHFNISVPMKRRRDIIIEKKMDCRVKCKKHSKGRQKFYCQKFPHGRILSNSRPSQEL